ncbi:hypothetical protein [Undibacterium sp. WLX3042]|uniref:hypothetical protein n=1 Tax=Undibacterium sp. WLX3042 TaxID=3412686 RepID=UPI003C2E65C8
MTESIRLARRMNLVYLVLFPGFFLYHTLATLEYIPSFLGGYSSLMALLVLPGIFFVYLHRYSNSVRPAFTLNIIYWVFLLYYLCIVALNIAIGTDMEVAVPQLGIILQFGVLYIFGSLYQHTSEKALRTLLISFSVMTLIVLLNIEDGAFRLVPAEIELQDDKLANHQNYAFVYSLVFLYLLSTIPSAKKRFLTFLVGGFILFVIGARSEFIGVFGAFVVLEVATSKYRGTISIIFVAMLVGLYLASDWIAEEFPNNRNVFLFGDFEGDVSRLARAYMFEQGMKTIYDNPIWGDFASYELGHHIHNGLSAWVDLGIIGFIVYAGLIAVPLIYLLMNFKRKSVNPDYRLALYLFVLTAFLALTSKHFTHQIFPIALGTFARYLNVTIPRLGQSK